MQSSDLSSNIVPAKPFNPDDYFLTNQAWNNRDMQRLQLLFLKPKEILNHPAYQHCFQNDKKFLEDYFDSRYPGFMQLRETGAKVFTISQKQIEVLACESDIYRGLVTIHSTIFPTGTPFNFERMFTALLISDFHQVDEQPDRPDLMTCIRSLKMLLVSFKRRFLQQLHLHFKNNFYEYLPRNGDLIHLDISSPGTTNWFIFTTPTNMELKSEFSIVPFDYPIKNNWSGSFPKAVKFLDPFPLDYYNGIPVLNFPFIVIKNIAIDKIRPLSLNSMRTGQLTKYCLPSLDEIGNGLCLPAVHGGKVLEHFLIKFDHKMLNGHFSIFKREGIYYYISPLTAEDDCSSILNSGDVDEDRAALKETISITLVGKRSISTNPANIYISDLLYYGFYTKNKGETGETK